MGSERARSVIRGLQGQCPRCQGRDLFQSRYRLRPQCPSCGLPLDQEDGWSLGAIPINYALTCIVWILPVGLAFIAGWLSLTTALVLAGLGAVVIPLLAYRLTKSLWVGVYYAVLPHELDSAGHKKTGCPAREHPDQV